MLEKHETCMKCGAQFNQIEYDLQRHHCPTDMMERVELFEALLGVKRGDCWCERGIGNPMLSSCTDACMRVKAIMFEITKG